MKLVNLTCCVVLIGTLTACSLSLTGNREYGAEMTAPGGLDYENHPDAALFQALLDDAVARGLPGAALLVRNPAGLWIGASGQSDIDRNLPFGPFTRSRIGSLTKTFTAAAVLRLAEEGLLGLDDIIADYLDPGVAAGVINSSRITIRQLLNHTSGLPREPMTVSAILALEIFANDPHKETTIEDYLAALKGKPALFEPGQGWSYSNFGYTLLGLILEDAAGQDQWEVLRSRILEPLDLADTFFDRELRTPPGLARGYADLYGDGSLTDTSDWDALHPLDAEGGIVSTVYDVYRFLDALFNGNLLTASSLAEMLTCVEESPGEGGNTYGLGIANSTIDGKPAYNHTGWVTGYLSAFCVYPEQQATVVLLINGSSGVPEAGFIELVTERLPPLLE